MTERAWIILIICTAIVLLFLIEKVTEYQKERIRKERWERWRRRRELTSTADDECDVTIIPPGTDVIQVPDFFKTKGSAANGT